MLKIRLQRVGKKKQAHYKIVVMEHTRKTTGKYLELLGWYNPHSKEIQVDQEKLNFYITNGAQMSPTVNNILVGRDIIKGKKVTSWKPKKKPPQEEKEKPAVESKPVENTEKEKPEKPAETEAPAEKDATKEEIDKNE